MTIYIDVVLFENLIMNYIILLATGVVLKTDLKHFRLIIASLIGSLYTVMAYIITIQFYSNFLFKILLSIIMIFIGFNPQNVKKMWKQLLVFYLASFVFGGAAFALIYLVKPQEILIKNGMFLGTYPLKTVILSAIVSFTIIIVVFKIVKNKISKKDMYRNLKIFINEKEIQVKAMLDTGNLLREPITGKPVIIVESSCLKETLPNEILNNLESIIRGDFSKISESIKNKYITRLKFIPFTSLGKQNGMLLGIKTDNVKIIEEEKEKKVDDVIIGIYNKSLTKDGRYRALIGIDLI